MNKTLLKAGELNTRLFTRITTNAPLMLFAAALVICMTIAAFALQSRADAANRKANYCAGRVAVRDWASERALCGVMK